MDWREYDRRAREYEDELEKQAPLLTWHVLRCDERVEPWQRLGSVGYDWIIRASIMIDKHKIVMEIPVIPNSADMKSYISRVIDNVAYALSREMIDWRPPVPR